MTDETKLEALLKEAKEIAYVLTNGGDDPEDPSYEVPFEDGPHHIIIWYADCDCVTVDPSEGETNESLAHAIVRSGHVIKALLANLAAEKARADDLSRKNLLSHEYIVNILRTVVEAAGESWTDWWEADWKDVVGLVTREKARADKAEEELDAIRGCCDTRCMNPPDGGDPSTSDMVWSLRQMRDAAEKERDRLLARINTPMLTSFLEGVLIEAAHQREKWGDGHDESKGPGQWALLFQYILGKQAKAVFANDWDKYLHHLVTMAAICFNAHRVTMTAIKRLDTQEGGG